MLVNLVNFRMYENGNTPSLYVLHFLFVFFVSIMLINFLIAVMTQSFSHVFENRRAIIQTQRLVLMITIQFRLAWPMQAVYKILQRKAFVFHNKRLCVCRTVIKGKDYGHNFFTQSGDGTWCVLTIRYHLKWTVIRSIVSCIPLVL